MEEKRYPPTSYSLKKAKERGDLPKSLELSRALTVFSALLLLWFFSFQLDDQLRQIFKVFNGALDSNFFSIFRPLAILVMILLLAIFCLNVGSHLIQTGWLWRFGKKGEKEPFQFAYFIFKLILSFFLGYWLLCHSILPGCPLFAPPEVQFRFICKKIFLVILSIALMHVALSLVHYFYRKWRHYKDLHMSSQQKKEELREIEGNRLLRNKIRENRQK